MPVHKLDRAKDKYFWSVRVSDDIRIIVLRSDTSLLLCYVDLTRGWSLNRCDNC